MLKNYFKIAIAVLKRRKFFTFISLFGISFTLTILIVLTAFIDHLVKPAYPDFNRDRELFVNRMRFESSKAGWMNQSNPSFYFFTNYVAKLKTPFKMALYTGAQPTNAYQNNKKIAVDLKYTNVTFWEVFRYEFVEGKAYNTRQVTNADKVAVITTDARTKYFGEGIPALGKYIEANNTQYRVIGVVKPAPSLSLYCSSDVYLPYTLSKINLKDRSLMGGFSATLLAEKEEDLPLIKNEFELMVKKLPPPDKEMDIVSSHAESYVDSYTQRFLDKNNSKSRYVLMLGASIFLFMLLPTINLVNINVSRIMERSSEIGVRKAFGASSNTLAYQFIVENLILTLFGGVLGLIFSIITITVLNSSGLVPNLDLQLNLTVLAYSLCACLVFGLFSGVYPAWRMSKLDVVTALKANN
jgi:putative ABC transport system permease protein